MSFVRDKRQTRHHAAMLDKFPRHPKQRGDEHEQSDEAI